MPTTPVVNHLLLVIGCHFLSMITTAFKPMLVEGNGQWGNISDEVRIDNDLGITNHWNNLRGKVALLILPACNTDSTADQVWTYMYIIGIHVLHDCKCMYIYYMYIMNTYSYKDGSCVLASFSRVTV